MFNAQCKLITLLESCVQCNVPTPGVSAAKSGPLFTTIYSQGSVESSAFLIARS